MDKSFAPDNPNFPSEPWQELHFTVYKLAASLSVKGLLSTGSMDASEEQERQLKTSPTMKIFKTMLHYKLP
jgi:lipopolysaccharide biosynthesis regulator YciM